MKRVFFIYLLLAFSIVPAAAEEPTKNVEAFFALPYLQGYHPAPDKVNVTRYDRRRASPGYNLYTSCHGIQATLMDMKGTVRHEWSYDASGIWPEEDQDKLCFENVHLFENGDLLGVVAHEGLIKLDRDSNLIWSRRCNCHHDIDVDEDGTIYTLTEERIEIREGKFLLDNSILLLSPEGTPLARFSLLDLLHRSQNPVAKELLQGVVSLALNVDEDVFHTNTVEYFDGRLARLAPSLYEKGNVMLSMLTTGTIAVINLKDQEFRWILGSEIWRQGQHAPTALGTGYLLIFDNHYQGTSDEGLSRIIEFHPLTRKVAWEYVDDSFFSATHGTVHRLPNGNTLITESDKGRAFEVTPKKEIVWEFLNPHRSRKDKKLIATLMNVVRIKPEDVSSWLK